MPPQKPAVTGAACLRIERILEDKLNDVQLKLADAEEEERNLNAKRGAMRWTMEKLKDQVWELEHDLAELVAHRGLEDGEVEGSSEEESEPLAYPVDNGSPDMVDS